MKLIRNITIILGISLLVGNNVSGISTIYKDINTLNIIDKLPKDKLYNIKSLCSYDKCFNISSKDIEHGIEEFIDKYLSKINNEDIKNTLKVKGIKITKVIFED